MNLCNLIHASRMLSRITTENDYATREIENNGKIDAKIIAFGSSVCQRFSKGNGSNIFDPQRQQ